MEEQKIDLASADTLQASDAGSAAPADVMNVGERLSKRNFFMFPLGTFGRDFLYNFFNGYLLSFVLLTKTLNTAQFSMITVIIVCARIFDALNDPIMGSIVENTRTKWGKYKPWQLIGAILTGGVIIALFNVPLDGWAFIGFLAFAYFMFSITFTMNDISYWGMMPSLTSNPDDRNKLTSFTQLVCSAGGGLAGLLVPLFTVGGIAQGLGLGAVNGYRLISIIVVILMVGFQLFTILGVKEKPLPANFEKTERTKLKDLFKVLFHNDQLLWCTLVMLIWNLISGIAVGNILTFYIYFEFGYEGMLGTVFSIVYAVLSVVFTLFYPWFSKKLGRNRTLYSCGITLIISYALLLVIGLSWPNSVGGGFDIMGMHITPKFLVMALLYGFTGWSTGFYMIMLINMANTVEYNEWRTGKRDEAIIFSLRPFTAKMGSALTQGIVSLVLIIAGALTYTNEISRIENEGTRLQQDMSEQLRAYVATIDEPTKMKLLACMCIIPMVLMAIALIIYKAKCKLDEPTLARMIAETEAKKAAKLAEESEQEADESEAAATLVEDENEDALSEEYQTPDEEVDGEETPSDDTLEEDTLSDEQTEEDYLDTNYDESGEEEYLDTDYNEEESEDQTEPVAYEAQDVPVDDDVREEPVAFDEDIQEEETSLDDDVREEEVTLDEDVPADEEEGIEEELVEEPVELEEPIEEDVTEEPVEVDEDIEIDEDIVAAVEEEPVEPAVEEEPVELEESEAEPEETADVEEEDVEEPEAGDDAEVAADENAPKYSLSFIAKLIQAPDEVKAYYSEVKNMLLSYSKVNTRISWHYEAVFVGRVKLARFVMHGKTLQIQLALPKKDVSKSKFAIDELKKGDYTCSYNLNGVRRVSYVSELISKLMKSHDVSLASRHKDKDFAAELPYQTTEELADCGKAKRLN